ncbi:hypothetical protein [Bradyrhizobium sp. th.b2]|uniref:hypothetical protein n=1 Tax=Bradyrhizobium sp. th-b2 TaxID=172088 RepID=UPI000406C942|nr:hypothetical protein [Bradyrhizobium sp. th.b2]
MSDKQNTAQELLSFIREARKFLRFVENPEWAGSAELTDVEHLDEMKTHLEKTRGRIDMPEKTVMHFVRNSETGLVLAMTGNTPEAAERARFLTGLMTSLPRLLQAIEESFVDAAFAEDRIKELITSNNEKLFENRGQRDEIRQLKAQVDLLLKSIPVPPEAV